VSFDESPLKLLIADNLFVLYRVVNRLLLKLPEPSVVTGDVVKQLALLFEQVHLHSSRQHVVAILHDLIFSLGFGEQAIKKVVFLL
jgi:ABC-type hemin transport system ATPase subunit